MTKQITIKEDGVSKSESVDFINTQVAGGSANWMPEDEAQTGVFYVHANGEYVPSEYGLYGFYAVSVMVPGGNGAETIQPGSLTPTYVTPLPATGLGASVIGVDPTDGAMYRTEIQDVDGVPTLVKTKVADSKQDYKPTSMKILIKPAKLSYNVGDKIQYAGLVVQLLDSTGYTFVDDKFPQGIISWSPVKNLLHPEYNLITPVNIVSSGTEDDRTDIVDPSSGYELGGPIGYTSAVLPNKNAPENNWLVIGYRKNSRGEMEEMRAAYMGDTPYVNVRYTWYNSFLGDEPRRGILFAVDGHFSFSQMYSPWAGGGVKNKTRDGKEFSYFGYEYFDMRVVPVGASSTIKHSSSVDELPLLAWYILYGFTGSNIPVQWKSPYDNQTYEDTFEIEVSGTESPSSGSDSSGGSSSGGGGGHSF